jgi:hypothetical protein
LFFAMIVHAATFGAWRDRCTSSTGRAIAGHFDTTELDSLHPVRRGVHDARGVHSPTHSTKSASARCSWTDGWTVICGPTSSSWGTRRHDNHEGQR